MIKRARVRSQDGEFEVQAGLREQAALDLEKQVDEGLGEVVPDAASVAPDEPSTAAALGAATAVLQEAAPNRDLHSFEIDPSQVLHWFARSELGEAWVSRA